MSRLLSRPPTDLPTHPRPPAASPFQYALLKIQWGMIPPAEHEPAG